VVAELIKLVRDQSVDEIGLNPAAIHALLDTRRDLARLDGSDPNATEGGGRRIENIRPRAFRRAAVTVLPTQTNPP